MSKGDGTRCLCCMEPVAGSVCSACGWIEDDVYDLQYARPGTLLSGRYLLGRYARKNGEGALYAGYDNVLGQKVWVREYFPQTIAGRALDTGRVSPLAGCGAQYKALMSDFVDICNEIKKLSLTEPVVPLENVISENNTVYAIYKGLELIRFEEYLEKRKGRLSTRNAISLLLPICNGLGVLHSHGQIHRGVSPYTIYADDSGKLYLWDFALSATRTSGSELDSELFSGYSAPEQYSLNGWQGTWTDVYAVGALFYRVLTGIVPPKATRIDKEQNQLASLSELLPELSSHISDAVQEAMSPVADDRFPTIQAFISRLAGPKISNTAVFDVNTVRREGGASKKKPPTRSVPAKPGPKDSIRKPVREKGGGTFKYVVLGTLIMLVVLVGIIYYFVTTQLGGLLGGNSSVNTMIPVEQSSQTEEPRQPEEPEVMPQFVGRKFSEIENDPSYQGKFIFSPRYELKPEWAGGTVYEQSPAAGDKLHAGETSVILWISQEDVFLPNVLGRTLEEATDILDNVDIKNVQVIERIVSGPEPGTVIQTMPEPGAKVNPARDAVILVVAKEYEAPDISSGAGSASNVEDDYDISPEDYYDPETGQYRGPVDRT